MRRVICLLVALLIPGLASGATIAVPSGGNLQAAIDAAAPGDVLVLDAGVSYLTSAPYQSFTLKRKTGGTGTDADVITIRTSNLTLLPPAGVRVQPATHGPAFAKIVGRGGAPVFATEPGASYYLLLGLEITTNGDTSLYTADVIDVAGSGSAPGGYPTPQERLSTHHIVYDRCFIHPAEITSTQLRSKVDYRTSGRGVQLSGSDNAVINSDIRGFGGYYFGTTSVVDAYGVYSGVASRRLLIKNNYIEAHTMNVFTGGGGGMTDNRATVSNATATQATLSTVQNLAVGDSIALRVQPYPQPQYGYPVSWQVGRVTAINGNTVTYEGYGTTGINRVPLMPGEAVWNGYSIDGYEVLGNTIAKIEQAGGKKGYLELKAARNFRIEGNDFVGEWPSDVALTPRNQGGDAPYTQTSNGVFRFNRGFFSRFFTVMGYDNEQSSEPSHDILVEHNLGIMAQYAVDPVVNHSILTAGGLRVTYRHNTLIEPDGSNSAVFTVAEPMLSFTFRDNIVSYGAYGWNCQAPVPCWPDAVRQKNVYVVDHGDGIDAAGVRSMYPADSAVASIADVGFVDFAGRNFRLASTSAFKGKGTDGADPGADIDALEAILGGAPAPTPVPTPTPTPDPIPTPTPAPKPCSDGTITHPIGTKYLTPAIRPNRVESERARYLSLGWAEDRVSRIPPNYYLELRCVGVP